MVRGGRVRVNGAGAAVAVMLLAAGAFGCARDAKPDAELVAAQPAPAEVPGGEAKNTARPERIAIRVLLVAHEGVEGSEATRSKEEAFERAQMLARMAKSGDPLVDLVPKYSEMPDAADHKGLFKVQTASPEPFGEEVVAAALATEQGQISRPVDTPEGYLIIERRPDPPPGPEKIGARHILITYAGSPRKMEGATRTEEEARKLAEQVVEMAREPDADWNALAAEYTDEPGSDATGGDLGVFERGAMVPAFERAAFVLEVGEVSDAVQSPFGFHIIKRYK
jgi:peptidyl-prolyl cis-trans isomerase NIMA-interacting 1